MSDKGNYASTLEREQLRQPQQSRTISIVSTWLKLREPGRLAITVRAAKAADGITSTTGGFAPNPARSSRIVSSGCVGRERTIVNVPTRPLHRSLVGASAARRLQTLHRDLDVKKGKARWHAELEDIRLAARALKGKEEDLDSREIVIEAALRLINGE